MKSEMSGRGLEEGIKDTCSFLAFSVFFNFLLLLAMAVIKKQSLRLEAKTANRRGPLLETRREDSPDKATRHTSTVLKQVRNSIFLDKNC